MATIAQLAKRIDLSERHVKTLIDAGVLKHMPSGRHDLDEQTIRYIRHLRQVKQGIEGGGKSSLSDARARKETAHAAKAEFELESAQREYCSVEHVAKCAVIEITLVRENFLAAPGKIADSLHMVDRGVAELLVRDEIYECLGRLAGGRGGVEFALEMINRSGGKANPKVLALIRDLLVDMDEDAMEVRTSDDA
jgi:hypothetical protein